LQVSILKPALKRYDCEWGISAAAGLQVKGPAWVAEVKANVYMIISGSLPLIKLSIASEINYNCMLYKRYILS